MHQRILRRKPRGRSWWITFGKLLEEYVRLCPKSVALFLVCSGPAKIRKHGLAAPLLLSPKNMLYVVQVQVHPTFCLYLGRHGVQPFPVPRAHHCARRHQAIEEERENPSHRQQLRPCSLGVLTSLGSGARNWAERESCTCTRVSPKLGCCESRMRKHNFFGCSALSKMAQGADCPLCERVGLP